VFGKGCRNELPTVQDIQVITDRSRKESDSAGKLQGGTRKTAKDFDATEEYSETQTMDGIDFKAIRLQIKKQQKANIPKNLDGISELWQQQIQGISDGAKRSRKSRLVYVKGNAFGQGETAVPVLASNNYTLEDGESSVFDRELSHNNKERFVDKGRKKKIVHEHLDHCQICGDGGMLVCCPHCPCAVHLECVGLKKPNDFYACPHHRCTGCQKDRSSAGGLLFPCHCCWRSFCEDCLPKEGVTFLDRVERFDALGYDSGSGLVIYINCSKECEDYARKVHGYIPPTSNSLLQTCPEPLSLSFNFGTMDDLEATKAKLEEESKHAILSSGRSTRSTSVNRKKLVETIKIDDSNIKENNDANNLVPTYSEEEPIALQRDIAQNRIEMKENITFFFPPGALGINVMVQDGRCIVESCKSWQTKLKPNDAIVSLNGHFLPYAEKWSNVSALFREGLQKNVKLGILRDGLARTPKLPSILRGVPINIMKDNVDKDLNRHYNKKVSEEMKKNLLENNTLA